MSYRSFVRLLPLAALAAAGVVAACSDDDITVPNENQPDIERAFATPGGIENIISKLFLQIHNGLYASTNSIWPQTAVMAFESASQLGNYGMGSHSAIPRAALDNARGNREEVEHFRVYDHMVRNARIASQAIFKLDEKLAGGATIGTPMRDARAKAFAFFEVGFALGHAALFYDSTAIVTPDVAKTLVGPQVPPLSNSTEVMAAAMKMLDSALAYATSTAATSSTDPLIIPGSGGSAWLAIPSGDISVTRFQQIIRSYRAKFRANLARTPAERDAVDWTKVIDDATKGIESDLVSQLNTTNGWTNTWIQQAAVSPGWHQITPFIFGMADTSGNYDAWLQKALLSREPFLIKTPDMRFPSGETRLLQQAPTKSSPNYQPLGSRLYVRNREVGQDTPSDPWGTSWYDFSRFFGIRGGSGNGPWPMLTRAEIDMLAAEGYLRTNQIAKAIPLIDRYRTAAGLASLAGITSATQPVPGQRIDKDSTTLDAAATVVRDAAGKYLFEVIPVPGSNSCVPNVPQAPSFTVTDCGNIFEALKWEKRMETAFTGFGQWFLDSRGWGDLTLNTPLEWPVPYQEMDARSLPFYNSKLGAGQGKYGF